MPSFVVISYCDAYVYDWLLGVCTLALYLGILSYYVADATLFVLVMAFFLIISYNFLGFYYRVVW